MTATAFTLETLPRDLYDRFFHEVPAGTVVSLGEDFYRRDSFADYWIPLKADGDLRTRFMASMYPEIELSPKELTFTAEAFDGAVMTIALGIENLLTPAQEEKPAELDRTPLESAARETAAFVADYFVRFSSNTTRRDFDEIIRKLRRQAWYKPDGIGGLEESLTTYLAEVTPRLEAAMVTYRGLRGSMSLEALREGLAKELAVLEELEAQVNSTTLLVQMHFVVTHAAVATGRRRAALEAKGEIFSGEALVYDLASLRDELFKRWDMATVKRYLAVSDELSASPGYDEWLHRAHTERFSFADRLSKYRTPYALERVKRLRAEIEGSISQPLEG